MNCSSRSIRKNPRRPRLPKTPRPPPAKAIRGAEPERTEKSSMEFKDGALLINKPAGISSFGVIEDLRVRLKGAGLKRSEWPTLGHGGTLDPFATGLLVVLVGEASKLARYFLGANKGYEGVFRFG